MRSKTKEASRAKAESAWRMAASCAALAHEADGKEEREYYTRMRDAWIGLANRCEFLDCPPITRRPRASSKPDGATVLRRGRASRLAERNV